MTVNPCGPLGRLESPTDSPASAVLRIIFAGSGRVPIFPFVIGWIADFFRLVWGLLYWNARKSWFQLRFPRVGGRSPCQHPSDSGRAMETQCEACLHWHNPTRFARVCPLLVATPGGPRCSVNTAAVRPFWGRAGGYFAGALLACYLTSAFGVFAFLRTIGYPVSIAHIVWPGLWYRVPQARSAYYYERGNLAFKAGRTKEGLLYFDNAYRFDPSNYVAGLALARNYQVPKPPISDAIFARLYREHPGQRAATAQDWFRALLARGDFAHVAELAARELRTDPARASPWMRALIFASRQNQNPAALRALLAGNESPLLAWRTLLETELLLRANDTPRARAALARPWPDSAPAFAFYYQVDELISLGDTFAALDQLGRHAARLDEETALALRLAAYARAGLATQLHYEVNDLLSRPLSQPAVKVLGAHLIRHPDPALFRLLYEKVGRAGWPLNNETAGGYFTLLCVAGAGGDQDRLRALSTRLKGVSPASVAPINAVEAFFNQETAVRRIAIFLPILPVPLEVTYALLERYPGPSRSSVATKP